MAREDDLFIAQQGLERGFLTPQQLQEALFDMYEHERVTGGERWPLGVVLVSSGIIAEPVLLSLLAERVRAAKGDLTESQQEDLGIGRLLVLSGALEPEQVNEALAVQKRQWKPGQPSRRLGEIVVEMGMATSEVVQRALSYQHTAVLECAACGRRYQAKGATPRSALKCPRCGGTLARSRELDFDEAIRLSEADPKTVRRPPPVPTATAPVGQQARIDRALALYVRQHSLVPPEAVREAQRVQLEMSRFGIEIALLDVMKRLGVLLPRHAQEIEKVDFASIVHGPGWAKQTVPGYRITRKIADGPAAQIFAAEPAFGGDTVAIKILHPDRARDPEVAARFRRESELLVKFDHPAIVKGIETGVVPPPRPNSPELHFLTTECVDAEALDHLIEASGALSLRHAVRVTAQIAHALMYLEKQGFLHREVRPEHILVDRAWYGRLSDLGLAAEGPAAAPEASAAAAAYMSPEQANGAEDLTPASDIYSLGLTLYAMLTGRPPFTGETADEVLHERFETGGAGSPDIGAAPAAAQPLLHRMLEPERRKRVSAYADLLEALKQIGSKASGVT